MRQSGKNYEAWSISEKVFPANGTVQEKIGFFLRYGVLAPSAHNTQPWVFKIQESELLILLDPKRMLGDSDPTKRQSYESVGTCVENITIAARHFGYLTKVTYLINELPAAEGLPVARIVFSSADSIVQEPLFKAIVERRNVRLDFDGKPCDQRFLEELGKLMAVSGKLNFIFSSDRPVIASCAEVVARGTEIAFAMPTFRKELGEWLRHNWSKRPDGMPAFTVGVPDVPSLIVPFAMGKLDTRKMQAKLAQQAVNSVSLIGVIFGDDIKENWVDAGRLFERIALTATMYSYCAQVMGAPVEFEETAKNLQTIFSAQKRPILFFRIGTPVKKPYLSPRRSAEEMML